MGQGGSSLGALRLQCSSKTISKFNLHGENNKIKHIGSSVQALCPYMEDAHAAILDLDGARSTSFFGVYDGHRGANVAQYCANKVHSQLLLDEGYPNDQGNALGHLFFRKTNPAMAQGLSNIEAWRLQWNTPRSISKYTIREKMVRIKYALSSMRGLCPYMQDAHAAILDLDGARSTSFFGVYYGHGGANVAKYCAEKVHTKLLLDEGYPKDLGNALGRVFSRVDVQLREYNEWRVLANTHHVNLPSFLKTSACVQGTPNFEGSTACVALARGYEIIVGNIGDSRCVLSWNGQAIDLSTDHRPNLPAELQRIENAGGQVTKDGVYFMCSRQAGVPKCRYRLNGMLPMSRSIGDFYFKSTETLLAMEQEVTCNPDVLTEAITHDTDFLLIASDGIWDFVSSQEAVNFVQEKFARHATILDLDGARSTSFFGVYDGHGGANLAKYCAEVHSELLLDEGYPNDLCNAFGRVFSRMDVQLKEYEEWRMLANVHRINMLSCLKTPAFVQGSSKFEGKTASLDLNREYQLIDGSVGDFRCVVSRHGQNHAPRNQWIKNYSTANSWPSNGMLGARRLFSTKVAYAPSSQPSPENTVVVCLDGSLEKFRESYIGGLGEICELCYNNGKRIDISKIYDGHPEMFTTPTSGYFWLKLVFGQRHLLFPVIAKNLYILGWKGGKWGAFVTKHNDNMEGYNLLEQAKVLSFSENYCDMVGDLPAVCIGPDAIREAFDTLYKFRGHDHKSARRALGIIVVNFCEAARFRSISKFISATFSGSSDSFLGEENSERVQNYGSSCKSSMKDIDTCLKKRQHVNESTSEALADIRIFNRSGHKKGVFSYEDPQSARSKYERSKFQRPTFVLHPWFSAEELRKSKNSD